MRNQKGITLIALVITIIVLLILAGVAIAMLTGDNGIITNAQASRSNTAYREADEQMRLAYMAVRTEIAARLANDTSYDAYAPDNAQKLKEIVDKDLTGFEGNNSKWTVNLEMSEDGTKATRIFMKCEAAAILQGTESKGNPDKPRTDGKACGEIVLEERTAKYTFDVTDTTESNPDDTDTNTTVGD